MGVESAALRVGELYRLGLHQRRGAGGTAVLEAFLAVRDQPFGAPFAATTTGAWTSAASRLRAGSTTGVANIAFDDIRLDSGAMPPPNGGGSPAPPPVAAFTATPTSGTAPLLVAFTDASTGNPTSWSWSFGDGGTSTAQSPTHTYQGPGTYDVTLTVTNADGSDPETRIGLVTVASAPGGGGSVPVAAFTAAPTSGTAPLLVAFTDASTGGPTSWSWSFGDGGTSSAQSPTHTYSGPGTYNVTLTVTNANGSDPETRIGLITVASAPGGGGSVLTFRPVADAQVKSTGPTTNYGKLTTIRLREGTPADTTTYRSYLKFDVSGLTGPVASVKLRLYVTDASPAGGRVYTADSGWTETGIKWSNAPAIAGSPLTSGGSGTVGTWAEFDLSGAVTANGTYTFALTTTSLNSVIYSSREGAQPPELVITLGAGAAARSIPISVRSAGVPLGTTQAAVSGRVDAAILAADNSLPSSGGYQILCQWGVAV